MATTRLRQIFVRQRSFFLLTFFFGVLLLAEGFFGYYNTKNLSALSETLYKDRLIAQNYIMSMQETVWESRAVREKNSDESKATLFIKLDSLIQLYSKTVLTEREEQIFSDLRQQVENIRGSASSGNEREYQETLEQGSILLNQLAGIQLEVGGEINRESHKLIENGKILRELETGIFLVMLVLILIFLKGNIVRRPGSSHELN